MTAVARTGPGATLAPSGLLQLVPRRPAGPLAGLDDLDHGRTLLQAGPGAYLRIYRPRPTVAFTGRDRLSAGYPAARSAAAALGFAPVLRAPGGRAVAYHRDSLCVEVVANGFGDLQAVEQRFVAVGQVFVDVLAGFGVDARLGQASGEVCPGRHSVLVEGRGKVVGTAQRLTARGFLIGAALVVDRPEPVREVTTTVYRHLGLPFDPGTLVAVTDLVPTCTTEAFATAVRQRFAAELDVVESAWPRTGRDRPDLESGAT